MRILLIREYPVGTIELNQIQDRTYSDTGVPVGTTELDQRQDFFRYRSTRRYYRTYSDTGVPVGTTGLIKIQEYP